MSVMGALGGVLAGEALVSTWAIQRLLRQYRAVFGTTSHARDVDGPLTENGRCLPWQPSPSPLDDDVQAPAGGGPDKGHPPVDVLHWTRDGDQWRLAGEIAPPGTPRR